MVRRPMGPWPSGYLAAVRSGQMVRRPMGPWPSDHLACRCTAATGAAAG